MANKPKTARQLLTDAAQYLQEHGFDADWTKKSDPTHSCGCFLHAIDAVRAYPATEGALEGRFAYLGRRDEFTEKADKAYVLAKTTLAGVVGTPSFSTGSLQRGGFRGLNATNDAAAACLIAADLLA